MRLKNLKSVPRGLELDPSDCVDVGLLCPTFCVPLSWFPTIWGRNNWSVELSTVEIKKFQLNMTRCSFYINKTANNYQTSCLNSWELDRWAAYPTFLEEVLAQSSGHPPGHFLEALEWFQCIIPDKILINMISYLATCAFFSAPLSVADCVDVSFRLPHFLLSMSKTHVS